MNCKKIVSDAADRPPNDKRKPKFYGILNIDPKSLCFVSLHFIIHREHLIAKYVKYENVWKIVLQIVNLITRNINTLSVKSFLEELTTKQMNYFFMIGCRIAIIYESLSETLKS